MAKKKQLTVQDTIISWQVIDDEDYISLTDIARKYGRISRSLGTIAESKF